MVSQAERARANALLAQLGVAPPYKPVWFCGASDDELRAMPRPVVWEIGLALRAAQGGRHHPHVKPFTTDKHKGWDVVEVIEDFDTDTYRLVYTVQFPDVVFVLCGFQKKSKKGRATPRLDKALIESRFAVAKKLAADPPPELAKRIAKYKAEVAAMTPGTPKGGKAPIRSKRR